MKNLVCALSVSLLTSCMSACLWAPNEQERGMGTERVLPGLGARTLEEQGRILEKSIKVETSLLVEVLSRCEKSGGIVSFCQAGDAMQPCVVYADGGTYPSSLKSTLSELRDQTEIFTKGTFSIPEVLRNVKITLTGCDEVTLRYDDALNLKSFCQNIIQLENVDKIKFTTQDGKKEGMGRLLADKVHLNEQLGALSLKEEKPIEGATAAPLTEVPVVDVRKYLEICLEPDEGNVFSLVGSQFMRWDNKKKLKDKIREEMNDTSREKIIAQLVDRNETVLDYGGAGFVYRAEGEFIGFKSLSQGDKRTMLTQFFEEPLCKKGRWTITESLSQAQFSLDMGRLEGKLLTEKTCLNLLELLCSFDENLCQRPDRELVVIECSKQGSTSRGAMGIGGQSVVTVNTPGVRINVCASGARVMTSTPVVEDKIVVFSGGLELKIKGVDSHLLTSFQKGSDGKYRVQDALPSYEEAVKTNPSPFN